MGEARCESCEAPAEVQTLDGGLWCIPCDISARELGYDNLPAELLPEEGDTP